MSRRSRGLAVTLALAALVLAGAKIEAEASNEARSKMHPILAQVMDEPTAPIAPVLKGALFGKQGRLRLNGKEALDLLVRTTATREQLEGLGLRVRTMHDGRATVTVPTDRLAALAERGDVSLIALPQTLWPSLATSVPETGVTYMRSESGGVWSGNTGAGVLVGVVDSGLDYDHLDFVDSAGTNRIACLWDQTLSPTVGGTTPTAYGYGTEWSTAEIAAGTCIEADDPDALGHGTHVTGTAAGNGGAPDGTGSSYTYTGMAPNASICFVKTDFSSNGIIDAMNYIFDQADALGLPAVINLSLGTQLGAHDGTNPMEEEIDFLVAQEPGRAVVVAAGNEGSDDIHSEIQAISGLSVIGPDFTVDSYSASAGAGNDVILISGYYPSTDDLEVHLWSPSGAHYSQALNVGFGTGCTALVSHADGDVQICNNDDSNLGEDTTDNEIVIVIVDNTASHDPAAGTWSMALSGLTVAGSGWVDFWMTSVLGGSRHKARFSTHVDVEETLGIPATAHDAITVGAYVTDLCWTDSSGTTRDFATGDVIGDIAYFSSRGPTRDGRSKPDITAPGSAIIASLAQEVSAALTAGGYGYIIADTNHSALQGTSMAAPHVTGAVALLLEDDPTLDVDDIKDLLADNAREDTFTAAYDVASFLSSHNYVFGPGKLNLGSWATNDAFETNDTYTSATNVISGQVLEGYIGSATDIDTFYLPDLAVGDSIQADLTSLPENYKLNLVRRTTLFGSCGVTTATVAASSDNSGTTNESVSYVLSVFSAPKYLRVLSSAGAFDLTDTYQLVPVITRLETSAVHNSTATAQVLPSFRQFKVAGSTSGILEKDFYKITAPSLATVTASGVGGRIVRILSSSGALLSSGVGSTSYTPAFPLLGTSTYYVEVRANLFVGSYTLTLTR